MSSKAGSFLLRSRRFFSTLQNPTPSQMDPFERYCFNPVLKWNPQVEEYFVKAYGAEHFSRISAALARPSCYSCVRVNTLKSTSDAVVDKLQVILKEAGATNSSRESQDFVDSDIAREHQSILKEETSGHETPKKGGLLGGLISKCQIPGLEYVVFVQGSGPHSIDYGYATDKPPKEIMVSRKCAEAVLRGAQVYVPGVMACSAHVEKGDVVAISAAVERPNSDGGWSVNMTRGTVLQGVPTGECSQTDVSTLHVLCAGMKQKQVNSFFLFLSKISAADPLYHERSGMYIGQGVTMMSRGGIFRASGGVAVDMTSRVYRLPSFNDVLQGDIFLQNLPSIVTAHALDPQKGERILDMCAAPGGKTTAIAILMNDEGEVLATDRSHNKVLDIQKLAEELGLNCIKTYRLDALKAVSRSNEFNDDGSVTASPSGGNPISNETINSSSTVKLQRDAVSAAACHDIAGLSINDCCKDSDRNEESNKRTYVSRADIRKSIRRMKNGPGRNQCKGARMENSKGFPPCSFDRVLLDAPCSALGLRPRLFSGEETIESLRNHGKYQRRMFDQAVQLVHPGGVIVYSTCTINPGENEALVRYALDTYKFLSLAPQHPRVGGPGLVGHYQYPDGHIEEWLKPGEEELVQRFDPSSSLDTIGFFIAKFIVSEEI